MLVLLHLKRRFQTLNRAQIKRTSALKGIAPPYWSLVWAKYRAWVAFWCSSQRPIAFQSCLTLCSIFCRAFSLVNCSTWAKSRTAASIHYFQSIYALFTPSQKRLLPFDASLKSDYLICCCLNSVWCRTVFALARQWARLDPGHWSELLRSAWTHQKDLQRRPGNRAYCRLLASAWYHYFLLQL